MARTHYVHFGGQATAPRTRGEDERGGSSLPALMSIAWGRPVTVEEPKRPPCQVRDLAMEAAPDVIRKVWCPSQVLLFSCGSTMTGPRSRRSTSGQTCAEGRTTSARSRSRLSGTTHQDCAHQEQHDGYIRIVAKWVHLFRNRRRFGVGVGRLRLNRRPALRAAGA